LLPAARICLLIAGFALAAAHAGKMLLGQGLRIG
jgi:hypothetical protein